MAHWFRWFYEDDQEDYDAWLRRRERRAQRIEEFEARQHRERRWIRGKDIAQWCARKPRLVELRSETQGISFDRSFDVDLAEQDRAYNALCRSILFGDFDGRGYNRMLLLDEMGCSILTAKRLRGHLSVPESDPTRQIRTLLSRCWFPRDLCLRWFEMEGQTPPPWLTSNIDESSPSQAPAWNNVSPPSVTPNVETSGLRKRRGRTPKWDWEEAEMFIRSTLDEKGEFKEFDSEWKCQAELERLVAKFFYDQDGAEPTESLIRTHVARALKRWRERQADKGR